MQTLLTIVIPCYNEEKTLEQCINRVRSIKDEKLDLQIIIVDDCSKDGSLNIAGKLALKYPEIQVLHHEVNQGKGAALRTGFQCATGDVVAVQDADLEYDPNDLKRLIRPLCENKADVVLGSRFLSSGAHRVFYFWHSMGNKFLTLLSNMYSDLNLTDMETCYKVFRRDVLQDIVIHENRFGFEPEIVAEIAHQRLRIYEMGISYDGRSYGEGKKIGMKDGFRAIYCILRYNAYRAPWPLQMLLYFFIGSLTALVDNIIFSGLFNNGVSLAVSVFTALFIAAIPDYFLCITILFRQKIRWKIPLEILLFFLVVSITGLFNLYITHLFLSLHFAPWRAHFAGIYAAFIFNFLGRKYLVFSEPESGSWK